MPGCRRDHRHQIPLRVVARRQQQRAVRGVVERHQNGGHPRVIEVVGGGQRVRAPGGLGVEATLVDDPRVGDVGGVVTQPRRVRRPQRPARDAQPEHADRTGQPIARLARKVLAVGNLHRDDRHRRQQTKQRRQQHPAVHEVAALPDPVQRLQQAADHHEGHHGRRTLHRPGHPAVVGRQRGAHERAAGVVRPSTRFPAAPTA